MASDRMIWPLSASPCWRTAISRCRARGSDRSWRTGSGSAPRRTRTVLSSGARLPLRAALGRQGPAGDVAVRGHAAAGASPEAYWLC